MKAICTITTQIFIIVLCIMSFQLVSGLQFMKGTTFASINRSLRLQQASTSPSSDWSSISNFRLLDSSLLLVGNVAPGYGRGSKKLGIPTANLPYFDKKLTEFECPNGVYFGWGKVADDSNLCTVIANIGKSPTFVGQVTTRRIDRCLL